MLSEGVRKGGTTADYEELYVDLGIPHVFKYHPPSESQQKKG